MANEATVNELAKCAIGSMDFDDEEFCVRVYKSDGRIIKEVQENMLKKEMRYIPKHDFMTECKGKYSNIIEAHLKQRSMNRLTKFWSIGWQKCRMNLNFLQPYSIWLFIF